jgi:hypothetical protein
MPQSTPATYRIYSGTERVSESLSEPITDLDVANDLARQISEQPNQRDSTITVRSHKVELGGQGEFRGIAAVFINGEDITSDDDRYPHEMTP